MEELIALDVGTTGVKAALLDRNGRILAEDYQSYPLAVHGDRVEQDPEDWWKGAVAVLSSVARRADLSKVAGIGLSGQMQDLIALEGNGDKGSGGAGSGSAGHDRAGSGGAGSGSAGHDRAGRAILYSDARARGQAERVTRRIGAEELCLRTGNVQDATGLLAKILWLRENEPARFAAVRRILFGAHDYIAWKLTGSEATDYTTLSTTGLLDIGANAYAYPLMQALDISPSLLPTIVRADHEDGGLLGEAAALIGLPEGTPVFHGAGDAGTTTIGAGAGVPGVLSCSVGTSGWLAETSYGGLADPRTGIFNLRHPDPSALIHVGPMLLAAGNVDWALEAFGPPPGSQDRYAIFTREATSAPPASGGLLFLPYLLGERSPFRDPEARGAFVGLSRSTARSAIYRSVLEGVAFSMRTIHDAMGREGAAAPQRLSLSGGGARSPLWPQIFADVFGCEVSVADHAEHAGLIGVFVIVSKALGWRNDYLPPAADSSAGVVFRPNARNRRVYERAYDVFRGLYPALRQSFGALAVKESEDRLQPDPSNSSSTRRDS